MHVVTSFALLINLWNNLSNYIVDIDLSDLCDYIREYVGLDYDYIPACVEQFISLHNHVRNYTTNY